MSELFSVRAKLPNSKMLLEKTTSNWNEKNECQNEQACLSRSINSGYQQDSDVSVLVWLNKIKVWQQGKTMLHGYRQFYNLCKFRRSLCRLCPRYWEKIWQIKLWSWQTTIHRQETKKWSVLWRWIGSKNNKRNCSPKT